MQFKNTVTSLNANEEGLANEGNPFGICSSVRAIETGL